MRDDMQAGQDEKPSWSDRLVRFYTHRVTRVLVVGLAVVSLPWSMWNVRTYFVNRHAVESACAGLVPMGEVADLPYSGGHISHNGESINLGDVSGSCMLFSTEAGEATDSSTGERMFFSAGVHTEPSEEPVSPKGNIEDLVGRFSPYLATPLGGGIPGQVTASGVKVMLDCDMPSRHVQGIMAGAGSDMAGFGPLGSGHQVGQETRDTLASIAVTMANRTAEKLGCEDRLPAPPESVPAVQGDLVPAAEAKGTCAWYGRALESGRGGSFVGLPDKVVETSVDSDVWTETCGLAVNPKDARTLWARESDHERQLMPAPEGKPAEWWASTQSFFGETAKNVKIEGLGSDPDTSLAPGTAGYNDEESVWWASSQCPDGPAVHTLTIGFPYDGFAASHFRPVFRAYVQDVAERRGCTDVTFPDADEFTHTGHG